MNDCAPLVSVCIPTYNRAASTLQAVQSALAQTYPNLEVVAVDDASSDETMAKLATLRDERLTVHRNERRLGQIANRNRSVELASGELIKFLDSDDLLAPECVAAMGAVMTSNPGVGLVFCRRRLVTEGRPTPGAEQWAKTYRTLHEGFGHLDAINDGGEMLRTWLASGAHANWIGEPTTVMVRRRVLVSSGGFDPRTPLTPDIGLWGRILARADVGFIDDELVCYRVGIGVESETTAGLAGHRSWLERLWTLEALAADSVAAGRFPEIQTLLADARREALRTALKLGRGGGGQRYPLAPFLSYARARAGTLTGRSLAVAQLSRTIEVNT